MKITIVLATTKNKFPMNLASVGIRFFGKTDFSHYAIRIEDQASGEVNYYDSTGGGARKRSPSIFLKYYRVNREYPVSKEISYIDYLEFWALHANKGYGFLQIVGLGLRLFKIIKYNPFGQGAKRIICNELVILLLNYMGYTDIKDVDSLDLVDTERILKKVL